MSKKSKLYDFTGKTAEEVVDDFMLDLQNVSDSDYREPKFRTSSMPFCPILFSMSSGHGSVDYGSQFYFSVGTVLHELIQNSASRGRVGSRILWGDWKCTGCKKIHHACHKPKELCKCGKPDQFSPRQNKGGEREWLYEEVTIEYKGLSGHIDGIVEVAPNKYWIIDFKTTGNKGGIVGDAKYPYRTNVLQISVYTYVMRERYNLNVVGWSLVYVDRAKPVRNLRDYKQIPHFWTKDNHERTGKKLAWATAAAPLARKIQKRLFQKHKMPTKEEILEIAKSRPCKTEAGWKAWMKAGWERVWGFDPDAKKCSNLKFCLKGDSACAKRITKQYKELLEGQLDQDTEGDLATTEQFDDGKK